MGIEHWDNSVLNKKMLLLVQSNIKRLETLYEGKAKSFANVLKDMHLLEEQFKQKLLFDDSHLESISEAMVGELFDEKPTVTNSKRVYVRLFHREMENLVVPKASKGWIKPLLESVLSSEKLGLAVFDSEDAAKESLRSDLYGYATLEITPEQDITGDRPEKVDSKLNCRLLTLSEVSLDDIVQFSYQGHDYPIINGVMKLPTKPVEGEDD